MKGPVVLGNTTQEVIRHRAGSEVMLDDDPVLQDYRIANYLLSYQGLVQKQILNNLTKHTGLHSELTHFLNHLRNPQCKLHNISSMYRALLRLK